MGSGTYTMTFGLLSDVAERWDISMGEAEIFLERAGYFAWVGVGDDA